MQFRLFEKHCSCKRANSSGKNETAFHFTRLFVTKTKDGGNVETLVRTVSGTSVIIPLSVSTRVLLWLSEFLNAASWETAKKSERVWIELTTF